MSIVVLLGSFIVLLLLGAPVAAAMLLSGFLSLLMDGMPVATVAERLLTGVNSYTLLAVPFFIFAAVVMNRGGLTDRLLGAAACFVGHFRGGTAQVDVLASIFFAGMSGSATADAASQGRILIPHMVKEGYGVGFAAGVNSASATIGAIIPPSITMIIYGSVTSISVGALFLAGILPGLLVGFGMMGVVAFIARRRSFPHAPHIPWRQRLPIVMRALPALLAPCIILGAIFSGIATPTEAGVIACAYALFLGFFVYRELKPKDVVPLLEETVQATAVPMLIIAAGSVFGFALTASGFGFLIEEVITGLTDSPLVFLCIVVGIFFIVGLVIEGTAALLIFVPMFWPLLGTYGINELQFAIIVIVTILVGTITPPVGVQLFIAADIAKISVFRVEIWPFVGVMMLAILLMMLFPQIVTIVPQLVM